jgi:hypothetical protein
MIFLIWLLNLVISIFNAVGCGHAWNYTKMQGGIAHFLNWMGAIMSACGFTWCILIPLSLGVQAMGYLTPEQTLAALELGYVLIIPAVLGSGLVITIDSWAQFYKRPGLLNGGVAAWNTFAQVRNTMNAIQVLPGAISHLGKVLGGGDSKRGGNDDGKGKAAMLIVFLVAASALSGILLTRWIILSMSRRSVLQSNEVD